MSFAIGLLDGLAGAADRRNEKAERAREMSILEALANGRASQQAAGAGRQSEASGGGLLASPGPASGFDPAAISPAIREGILESAAELEMDPGDLATIISYETAGTFDPRKKGPRTQWGQHEGLIQFGEPQAKEYGVNWEDPVRSQLGKNGAIVRYFRQNGWKPGMGMMDAYSIVNAGGPGRYGASDAGNGGAPGTVADKVNSQMTGHREKALALLGYQAPAAPAATQKDTGHSWRWFQNRMKGGAQ